MQWNYQSASSTPESWNGVTIAVAREEKSPDGEAALEVTPEYGSDALQWPSFLNYVAPAAALAGARAVEISFWAKGEPGTVLAVHVTSDRNSAHPTPTDSFTLDGKWKKIVFRESIQAPLGGKWACAPRIGFSKIQAGQVVFLGPVLLNVIQ